MATGPGGFATGIVWQNPPTDIPHDGRLMKVGDVKHVAGTWGFTAKVTDGPGHLKGKRVRFISFGGSSCNAWGARAGYLVASRKLEQLPTEDSGKAVAFLRAYDYSESWWNSFGRFFDGENWAYPGEMTSENWLP